MPIYSNPKTYLSAGLSDPRDKAIRVEQTVDLAGKVTAVKYFMVNGDTVEDSLSYGSNSTTEPVVFTRGILVEAPLPVMLTTFNLSANGTTFNYTVVGGTVTALVGKLMVGATNYPLTHVSSGVATINTSIKLGDVVSFTVTSSSPALSTPVTGSVVVNNSTQVIPTLTLSGWSVAANGTTVNYTATNGTVTALSGNMNVAGTNVPLNHVSSGVASVTTPITVGQAVAVTIANTTPTLATAVNNVTVTNNSTVSGPVSTLSGFVVAANGTSVTYSNSGSPVTAITGFLTVAGTNYPLTHASNLNATVSSAINQGAVVTVTVSSTTPPLTAAISGQAVTNNSTVVGLSKQSLSWTGDVGLTVTGDNVALDAANKKAVASNAINSAAAFEVIGRITANITGSHYIVMLGQNTTPPANWGADNAANVKTFVFAYNNQPTHGVNTVAGAFTFGAAPLPSSPLWYRLKSVTAGTVVSAFSTNGSTWVDVRTVSGLTGNLYLKTLTAGADTAYTASVELYV